jgi:DNA invertase Pin-like site-specific DNA recombinase
VSDSPVSPLPAVGVYGTLRPMSHRLGYARVSTPDQDPALQLDALTKAGCARVWTETASGARAARPALDQVLDRLLPGDTLVVWRLDRLGRSLQHLITTVTDLNARGIGFTSITETIDTTTPTGRLTFHVFAALAEFERSIIIERTNAGLAAARARGRTGGRPPKMTPEKLRHAQRMYEDGTSIPEISKTLSVSRATIYRHFKENSNV